MSPFVTVKCSLGVKVTSQWRTTVQRVRCFWVGCRRKDWGGRCLVCNLIFKEQIGQNVNLW